MITQNVASQLELDLHELTWQESLPAFIAFYNEAIQRAAGGPAQRLNVIHGYGSTGEGGVLRSRLHGFLQEHATQGRLEFTPGEHADANLGHTFVVPIRPLPDMDELLAVDVLAYCAKPRTLSKISGKFRRHGEPTVKAVIVSLVRQRRLRASGKGHRKTYLAIKLNALSRTRIEF